MSKKGIKNNNHIDVFLLTSKNPSWLIKTCLSSLRVFVTQYTGDNYNPEILDTYIKNIKNSEVVIYYNGENTNFINDYDKILLGVALSLNKPVINFIDDVNYKMLDPSILYMVSKLAKNNSAELECERKFLINDEIFSKFIASFDMSHIYQITQFFDDNGVRYRKTKEGKNTVYDKNMKSNTPFGKACRFEIECNISKKEYDLKKKEFKSSKTYNREINKTRWVYEIDDMYGKFIKFEFNEIKIGSRFLYLLEIEVPSPNAEKEAAQFINSYLHNNKEIIDVTDDNLITHKKLMSLDTKNHKEFLSYVDYVNGLCPNSFVKSVKEKKKK